MNHVDQINKLTKTQSMINKRLIWTVIFNRCVIIDVLSDVWVEEVIKELVEGFVIKVWSDMMIDTLSGV